VLIGLTLFTVLLGPLVRILGSATRTSYSADRLLRATRHGQTLLEALASLEPREVPLGTPPPAEALLYDAAGGLRGPGAGRWDEVEAFFASPPPFPMERTLRALATPGGRVVFRLEMTWLAQPDRPESARTLTLDALAKPLLWQ